MSSDEIAADFKDCLNDLQLNVRHEISNLTIIAKENIEHAQALSRTLENHIRTVRYPAVKHYYCHVLLSSNSVDFKIMKSC